MNKTYNTLYKRTATGAIQTWKMEQEGCKYRTHSGQKDSPNIVITEWTICEGKNLGKKNETSPESQATAEIEAQYKKKLAQGNYNESINDIDEDNYFKPMLAKSLDDYPVTKKQFESGIVYSSYKIDGTRLVATKNGLFSRNGKTYSSIPHIEKVLKPLFDKNPNLILDGELYNHDLKDDFNKIISLVRKSKPSQEDLKESESVIQYWVYDIYSEDSFSKRYASLTQLLSPITSTGYIKIVGVDKVTSQDHLMQLYSKYVEDGFEGQMIRLDGFPYENKRVNHLLKHKSFMDDEFEISSIEEGEGNRSGMAGYVVYKLKDGRSFRSNIRGGVDFYTEVLKEADEYVGGQGTVRFFNYTPDGKPRFPVTIALFKGKRDV